MQGDVGEAARQGLDERETAQTSGITTALILAHVESRGGRAAVEEVLRRIGRCDREEALRDERTWWAWDTKIALFEAAAEVLGDDRVTYNAGRTALESGVAAPLKAALRALGSPRIVYSNIVRANHKFSTSAQMVLDEISGHRARVRYEMLIDAAPHRLDCLYNQGLLACVPMLFGLPAARVEHPECALEGAEECIYEVRWLPRTRPSWRAMAGAGAVTAAVVAGAAALAPALAIAAAGAGAAGLAWWTARARQDLIDAMTALERELDLRSERTERIRASLHALSSALDHDDVVSLITDHGSRALGGQDCVLLLEQDGVWRAQPSPVLTGSLGADLERWLASGSDALETTITIDDLSSVPALAALPSLTPSAASLCAAPLNAQGQRLGVLVALAQRPFSFLPRDVSVLELFAEQAAIALFNAQLYASQQELATHDPLTGLRNHRDFHETLDREIARCRRSAARLSVALLDLDRFKEVNDGAGHAAGDRLLREVGLALEASARAGDLVFRVGGDEFGVLLPDADAGEAHAALLRIAAAGGAVDPRVGVSWGIATWPSDGTEKTPLLATADERLYAMKRDRGARAPARSDAFVMTALGTLVRTMQANGEDTSAVEALLQELGRRG